MNFQVFEKKAAMESHVWVVMYYTIFASIFFTLFTNAAKFELLLFFFAQNVLEEFARSDNRDGMSALT